MSVDVHAHDVRGAGEKLRIDQQWLRRNAQLRDVQREPNLQCERLPSDVHAHDVRGPRQELRIAQRWLRRDAELRNVQRHADVHRERLPDDGHRHLQSERIGLWSREVQRHRRLQRQDVQVHLASGRRERRAHRLRHNGRLLQLDSAGQRGLGNHRLAARPDVQLK